MKVFANTGFLIALLNPRYALHVKAQHLESSGIFSAIITTEMVLAEFLNDFGSRGKELRSSAHEFVSQLQHYELFMIIQQTSLQFWNAVHLYQARTDKGWSLTNCASFLAMSDLGIQQALTYDRHFEQMGFRALLREG